MNCESELDRIRLATAPIHAYHRSRLIRRVKKMNRRKKIQQLLKAHAKKASAKLAPQSKEKYISKADRLKLAAEASADSAVTPES